MLITDTLQTGIGDCETPTIVLPPGLRDGRASLLDNSTLLLINAAVDASFGEMQTRGLSLAAATQRLFALAESGERDFKVLKAAALDMPYTAEEANDDRKAG